MTLDGQPVGEQNGIGAFTNAQRRVLYSSLDVTDRLAAGSAHTLGFMLGHGMCPRLSQ